MRLLTIPADPSGPYTLISVPSTTSIAYIAISHVWMDPGTTYENEILFHEILLPDIWTRKPRGAAKLRGACSAARTWSSRRRGLNPSLPEVNHIWMDTCCVDQQNPVELTTAINSMYRWYQNAYTCFVYLADITLSPSTPSGHYPDLSPCKWFSRGWTLQELVASNSTQFFSREWTWLGDKDTLQSTLTKITKILGHYLEGSKPIRSASIAQRMSWAAGRVTRPEEDMAYSLMEIFGVQMPTLYGEGKESAFRRLQEEIVRYSTDHSIFAWCIPPSLPPPPPLPLDCDRDQLVFVVRAKEQEPKGLLSSSPDYFIHSGQYQHNPTLATNEPFSLTNKGLSIVLPIQKVGGLFIASIDCFVGGGQFLGAYVAFDPRAGVYERVRMAELCRVDTQSRGKVTRIFVRHRSDI